LIKNTQSYTKNERLLKPSEFQRVYKQGKWAANREVVINFENHQSETSRLGITVSKKVSKRAVDRNRIKRQIREWFRAQKKQFCSIDIVITAKPALNIKSSEEIQNSLDDIWRKAQKKF
jgi:ribonuclease P protein component